MRKGTQWAGTHALWLHVTPLAWSACEKERSERGHTLSGYMGPASRVAGWPGQCTAQTPHAEEDHLSSEFLMHKLWLICLQPTLLQLAKQLQPCSVCGAGLGLLFLLHFLVDLHVHLWSGELVSSWILTSCQPHRVKSGWSTYSVFLYTSSQHKSLNHKFVTM